MKTFLKILNVILLVFLLTLGMILPCFATSMTGKITVILQDKDKNKLNGQAVYACQIAELNGSGYYPTSAFENSGISISGIVNNPDISSAKAVAKYIKGSELPFESKIS